MRVGKSHLVFHQGMQKRRGSEDGVGRAVTLPRTPDSSFYFPLHVLFRGHFVLFGSSLWLLIAQLMSGDGFLPADELVMSLDVGRGTLGPSLSPVPR